MAKFSVKGLPSLNLRGCLFRNLNARLGLAIIRHQRCASTHLSFNLANGGGHTKSLSGAEFLQDISSGQKRSFCQQPPLSKPVLTLFTKDYCPLCDDALEELGEVNLAKVTLETVDIEEDGNEDWFNKFRYEIPVFFLDKKFLCKNRIDLATFHSALEEYHLNQKN